MDLGGNKRVFNRLGPSNDHKNQKVCYHWRAGNCSRFSCPFLHRELPGVPAPFSNNGSSSKRANGFSGDQQQNGARRNNNFSSSSSWGRVNGGRNGGQGGGVGGRGVVVQKVEKLCNYWVQGKCSYGDRCKYLHSWCSGDCFSLVTQLEGHQKSVTGITMPSGSDKLYSGSKDASVRVWDCQSGQAFIRFQDVVYSGSLSTREQFIWTLDHGLTPNQGLVEEYMGQI